MAGWSAMATPVTSAACQAQGVHLVALYRIAKHDPNSCWSAQLSRLCYLIDLVFGQLMDRRAVKRVWARDLWHLCGRLLRTVLMHMQVVLLNGELATCPCISLRRWLEKLAHRVS